MTVGFEPSSRITALMENRKSIGASCNVYKVEDTITGIADAHAWAFEVLAYQGAPSIDFSKLRPSGSPLSTGGYSSGAVSFMHPYDAILKIMRRTEKKNSAGLACLDWKHPELEAFLDEPLTQLYKAVYIPMHDTIDAEEFRHSPIFSVLEQAYNEYKCFLVKRPLPLYGTELLVNLCTEVEIPHKGQCILGAYNLAVYADLEEFANYFVVDFTNSARQMLDFMQVSNSVSARSPLHCSDPLNQQFGLGVLGLASALANFGITYQQLAEAFEKIFSGIQFYDDIESLYGNAQLAYYLSSGEEQHTKAFLFCMTVIKAYYQATKVVENKVRAAFCIQPTVNTSQRLFDSQGFSVSPEIQPVIGLRHEDGVSTIIKSAIRGDRLINYHPKTETIFDCDYQVYAKVSAYWQLMMDMTGLAHRHSHCVYGDRFNLSDYYTGNLKPIKSLYYRLPNNTNIESMKKDTLWQTVEDGELADFDLTDLLKSCTIEEASCDCQN